MKVLVEIYGDSIGAHDKDVISVLEKGECKVLLTLQDEGQQTRSQFILGKDDLKQLTDGLDAVYRSLYEMNVLFDSFGLKDKKGFTLV